MEHIEQAVKVLNDGGIIIFPTDTAFGIGCRMDKPEAVNRLFALRRRPLTHATPVLVSSIDMALTYWNNPPDIVRLLAKKYWPGGLTIVAQGNEYMIYSPIRGGGGTIGLRMPDHLTALELIRRIGVGLLGPSANFHGEDTPYTQAELDPELIKLVDYVIPGETKGVRASTVIDCSVTPPVIKRQGVVEIEDLS